MAELLTTTEVAELLRVHPKHVYRLLARGLPAKRVGGKWLFAREEVLAWASGAGAGEPASAKSEVPGLVAANGDLAIELLLASARDSGTLVGFVQADRTTARTLFDEGRVLAAGVHGVGTPLTGGEHAWLHLVDREVGLATRRGRRIEVVDLSTLRLASRPKTAGVRQLLDDELRRSGLRSQSVHRRALVVDSHREAVLTVVRGEADVALASAAWARRAGLAFLPLAVEPYGLLLRAAMLGVPLVRRVCELAQSNVYRRTVAEVAGYSVQHTGALTLAAAPTD